MIRLEQLRFGYDGGDDVLRLDEFVLEPESNILVVGPSGCGKTTLLHLIAGLLAAHQRFRRRRRTGSGGASPAARDRFRGRHIGIVLQQFHLLPTLTAMQNLLVAQSIAGLPVDRDGRTRMLNALGVDERVDAYPHQLSVGQQQRVAIARALGESSRSCCSRTSRRRISTTRLVPRSPICLLSATQRHAVSLVIATHDTPSEVEDPRASSRLPRRPAEPGA